MAFVNTSVSLRKYIINYTPPYTNPIIGIEYNSSTHTWRRIGPDSNEVFPNSNYFDNHPIYSQITPVTIDSCAMVKIPKFYFLYQNFTNGHRWWISNSAFTIENVGTATVHTGFIYNGVTKDQFYVGAYNCSTDPNDSSKTISVLGSSPLVSINFTNMVTRCRARNNGDTVTGFDLWNIYQLGAIQLLCLIEIGTGDVQTAIGVGDIKEISGQNPPGVSGSSNAVWRGIYELWANVWQMVSGVELRSGKHFYWWQDSGNTTFSSAEFSAPGSSSSNNDGWISSISNIGAAKGVFLVTSVTDTKSSSMFNDYTYISYNTSMYLHGGSTINNDKCGLFATDINNSPSSVNSTYGYTMGGRLSKV